MTLFNPQPYKDAYISIMRNFFLTSSIGMALIGSSINFIKFRKIIIVLAIIIITYSIIYGIVAAVDSYEYINIIKKQKNLPELYSAVLKNWDKWIKLSYVYMAIISILAFVVFLRKVY